MQILQNEVYQYWCGSRRLRMSMLPARERLRLCVERVTPAQRAEIHDDMSRIEQYTTNIILHGRITELLQSVSVHDAQTAAFANRVRSKVGA